MFHLRCMFAFDILANFSRSRKLWCFIVFPFCVLKLTAEKVHWRREKYFSWVNRWNRPAYSNQNGVLCCFAHSLIRDIFSECQGLLGPSSVFIFPLLFLIVHLLLLLDLSCKFPMGTKAYVLIFHRLHTITSNLKSDSDDSKSFLSTTQVFQTGSRPDKKTQGQKYKLHVHNPARITSQKQTTTDKYWPPNS